MESATARQAEQEGQAAQDLEHEEQEPALSKQQMKRRRQRVARAAQGELAAIGGGGQALGAEAAGQAWVSCKKKGGMLCAISRPDLVCLLHKSQEDHEKQYGKDPDICALVVQLQQELEAPGAEKAESDTCMAHMLEAFLLSSGGAAVLSMKDLLHLGIVNKGLNKLANLVLLRSCGSTRAGMSMVRNISSMLGAAIGVERAEGEQGLDILKEYFAMKDGVNSMQLLMETACSAATRLASVPDMGYSVL